MTSIQIVMVALLISTTLTVIAVIVGSYIRVSQSGSFDISEAEDQCQEDYLIAYKKNKTR